MFEPLIWLIIFLISALALGVVSWQEALIHRFAQVLCSHCGMRFPFRVDVREVASHNSRTDKKRRITRITVPVRYQTRSKMICRYCGEKTVVEVTEAGCLGTWPEWKDDTFDPPPAYVALTAKVPPT